MIGAIIKILLGVFIWKVVPLWIEYGSKKVRSYIQLALNILGILIMISGILNLLGSIGLT